MVFSNLKKKGFIEEYQSINGYLNWLSVNTRPTTNTAYSLLSQFKSNPSAGHTESVKYHLRYLKHTALHGIWFKQEENILSGCCAIPEEIWGNNSYLFTDSNSGPQDASKPQQTETSTVSEKEHKSI